MKVVLLIAYLVVSAVVIVTLPPIVAEFPEYVQFSMIDAGQALSATSFTRIKSQALSWCNSLHGRC
jgi:hypothetical protein